MRNYKFKAILASQLPTQIRDENGENHAIRIDNRNDLLSNIQKHLPHTNSIVVIAKNPNGHELNDYIAAYRFQSFRLSGFHFKEEIVLDNRNEKNAKEIIENASIIILLGGKMTSQMEFLNKIHFKKHLKNFKGILIGISTGNMTMFDKILNFPEKASDIGQPLYVNGLGLFDGLLIPHFNGRTYQYQYDGIDVVNDYIAPFSFNRNIHAIPDGSYYLYNGDELKLYGTEYLLNDGKVYEKI